MQTGNSLKRDLRITFIQTGGTIDKDYPRSTKGYAFEISEPAVKRILEKLNPSFHFEIISALKKTAWTLPARTDKKFTIYAVAKQTTPSATKSSSPTAPIRCWKWLKN